MAHAPFRKIVAAAMLGLVTAEQPVARSASSENAAAVAGTEADVAGSKASAANHELAEALAAAARANTAALSARMAASAAVVADAYAPEKSGLVPTSLAVGAPVEKEGTPQPGDVVKYSEVTPGDHLKYNTGVYEGCFEDSHCFFDCPSGYHTSKYPGGKSGGIKSGSCNTFCCPDAHVSPPPPYSGSGCYEDQRCFFTCPPGFEADPTFYRGATSDMCTDFCCPINRPPPPPPLPPCSGFSSHDERCAARVDNPECFRAYAAQLAHRHGLPTSYYQEILECSCLGQPPEMCIGHSQLVAQPPPFMLRMGVGFGAVGATVGAISGVALGVLLVRRRRRDNTGLM